MRIGALQSAEVAAPVANPDARDEEAELGRLGILWLCCQVSGEY
jgi:hypothetical protein